MAKEIIIEVRGGVIQDVYSKDKEIKVKVIDWDEHELDKDVTASNYKLVEESKGMFSVY